MSGSHFQCVCICGKTNHIEHDGTAFVCSCGRPSILDWGMGYTERELIEILNGLDVQRDRVAKVIELRREKRTAA